MSWPRWKALLNGRACGKQDIESGELLREAYPEFALGSSASPPGAGSDSGCGNDSFASPPGRGAARVGRTRRTASERHLRYDRRDIVMTALRTYREGNGLISDCQYRDDGLESQDSW